MNKTEIKVSMETLNYICQSTQIPVFIMNLDHKIIIENGSFKEKSKGGLGGKILAALIKRRIAKSGLQYVSIDEIIYTINIIFLRNEGLIIAEIIKNESYRALLNNPLVKEYLEYIFSKVRNMAGNVTIVCDELKTLLEKSETALDYKGIGIIDANVKGLLDEFLIPEVLCYFDMNGVDCGDVFNGTTMDLSAFFINVAKNTDKMLSKIKITKEVEKGIFLKINKSALETIIAEFLEQCVNVERLPSEIIFHLSRKDDEKATLRISSVKGDVLNIFYNDKQTPVNAKKILFGYLVDLFNNRYNCDFTFSDKDGNQSFILDIPVESEHTISLSFSNPFEEVNGKFSPVILKLAKYA